MIFYYSATGNSRAIAVELGKRLNHKVIDIAKEPVASFEDKHHIFVFPVWAWGPATPMLDFISKFPENILVGVKCDIVCSCGDDCGYTAEILWKEIQNKGGICGSAWSIKMPNTYVVLPFFDVDSEKIKNIKLTALPHAIDSIAVSIKNNTTGDLTFHGSFAKLKSGIFRKWFLKHPLNFKKWAVNTNCVRCGKCVSACPKHNLKLSLNSNCPEWGDLCDGCLACYHKCPLHAINYGNITQKKGQYVFPLENSNIISS